MADSDVQPLNSEQQAVVARLLPLARKIARDEHPGDDEYESEAMLGLCEAVATHDGRAPLKQWAAWVIRQKLHNLGAKQTARREEPLTTRPAPVGSHVHEAVARLPEPYRTYAQERWLDRQKLRDVAGRHGLSCYQLRQRLQESKRLLRQLLDDQP